MNKNNNNKVKIAIIVVLSCLILSLGLLILIINNNNTNNSNINVTINQQDVESRKIYEQNKKINDDYVGIIKFDSGLIDLPFVKSNLEDINEAYLQYERTDWKTMEHDEEGSIFMDPNNILEDQNIVLYGHYVYPHLDETRTHKFTPLHQLKDKRTYYDNNEITLYLENEYRKYEIVYVYYADVILEDGTSLVPYGMEYMRTNFSERQLAYYQNFISDKLFFNTGKKLEPSDKFLTLQTCVENRDDLRLIVVAKEVTRKQYELGN